MIKCAAHILVLEDNQDDVFLMERAFRKNGIEGCMKVVPDGQEGIHYMSGDGRYADRNLHPIPDVIITDLKMPRKSGLEFLEWMRTHPEHRVIPTILLSSSQQNVDVKRAYDLGVNTYFVKPGNFQELVELVRSLEDYWRKVRRPPNKK